MRKTGATENNDMSDDHAPKKGLSPIATIGIVLGALVLACGGGCVGCMTLGLFAPKPPPVRIDPEVPMDGSVSTDFDPYEAVAALELRVSPWRDPVIVRNRARSLMGMIIFPAGSSPEETAEALIKMANVLERIGIEQSPLGFLEDLQRGVDERHRSLHLADVIPVYVRERGRSRTHSEAMREAMREAAVKDAERTTEALKKHMSELPGK